jgi:hypothetical protein
MSARDHLFISYATEDWSLADWFARRLAAAGYAVWYDRFKLLGGEPWPQDIEVAIDQRTFRMLALISHASKEKRNPTGERKKGEAVGKREGISDFVIPLNVDLATSDVPWDLMGTQYIDFSHSWAKGFAGVLTKLEKLNAPRTLSDGASLVHRTVIDSSALRVREESLVSNCLRVRDLPSEILKCVFLDELTGAEKDVLRAHGVVRPLGEKSVLTFREPPTDILGKNKLDFVERCQWRESPDVFGVDTRDAVVSLIHASIDSHFRSVGFVRDAHGWHLPHLFRPKSRLDFLAIDGGRSWVKGNGTRTFGRGKTKRPYRYYLGANIRVLRSESLDGLMLMVKLRIHLTSTKDEDLGKRGGLARRKHLCKSWFNGEWLARTLAVVQTLWSEQGLIRAGDVVIDGWPLLFTCPVGIDETKAEKADDATLDKVGATDDEGDDE